MLQPNLLRRAQIKVRIFEKNINGFIYYEQMSTPDHCLNFMLSNFNVSIYIYI